jgi:hypothetical protein
VDFWKFNDLIPRDLDAKTPLSNKASMVNSKIL